MALCTLPSDAASSSTWVIYLQFLEKDGEIIVCVYCGSATSSEGGNVRLQRYDSFFDRGATPSNISQNIRDLVADGYTRSGTSCLASTTIPGNALDYQFLRALILLLEGTFQAKLWSIKPSTYGSLTSQSLWPQNKIPYAGLNFGSPLSEVHPPRVLDIMGIANPTADTRKDDQDRKREQRKFNKSTKERIDKQEIQARDREARKLNIARTEKQEAQRIANKTYRESVKGREKRLIAGKLYRESDKGKQVAAALKVRKAKAKEEAASSVGK
ncbi:uncharacterized protein J4E87_007250 [Alternaria ethzedia]|uniref:uncharacterized protein n=1 Tax=Alternaria ethzedia TaxID=181014 RepID=UPI0020C29B9E|nr:uncharacterized protein J4E87_007250 [Alternaria ethzedia]KAI4620562.1 hypothetical protein J4E87_007250 [Alternaria ethzedia]